jgi:hypothetical protein
MPRRKRRKIAADQNENSATAAPNEDAGAAQSGVAAGPAQSIADGAAPDTIKGFQVDKAIDFNKEAEEYYEFLGRENAHEILENLLEQIQETNDFYKAVQKFEGTLK